MEINVHLTGAVCDGYRFVPEQKWLGLHLKGAGFVRCQFRPRLMPVYELETKVDENGARVPVLDSKGNTKRIVTGKDTKGNPIYKVGYWTVKVEYSWTNPETGVIHNSTFRGYDENGNPIDVSLWAYHAMSKEEAEAICKLPLKDICMRKGVFQDGDTIKTRYTWDSVLVNDGTTDGYTYTPSGKKRGYLDYDAEQPKAE